MVLRAYGCIIAAKNFKYFYGIFSVSFQVLYMCLVLLILIVTQLQLD